MTNLFALKGLLKNKQFNIAMQEIDQSEELFNLIIMQEKGRIN